MSQINDLNTKITFLYIYISMFIDSFMSALFIKFECKICKWEGKAVVFIWNLL